MILALTLLAATALPWAVPAPSRHGFLRRGLSFALLVLLCRLTLAWSDATAMFPHPLPESIELSHALLLALSQIVIGIAVFWTGDGFPAAPTGLVAAAALAMVGACSADWPRLCGALELLGDAFAGPFLLFSSRLATTISFVAVIWACTNWRSLRRARLLGSLVLVWLVVTVGFRMWLSAAGGLGPKDLADAAGIATNQLSPTMDVVWLAPDRARRTPRMSVRMAADGVDLTPESLDSLARFLQRVSMRHVFAREALTDLRLGWRRWWAADQALDAAMLRVPDDIAPDYIHALELIKCGPLTDERLRKLDALAAMADSSSDGLHGIAASQSIYEGFLAAYARFGDEKKARHWLTRLDNLLPVSERKPEITPLEDFRTGSVHGSISLDGRPARSVRIGLFMLWRSSAAATPSSLLADSAFPDDDGAFEFEHLGPGEYKLGLLGRVEDLRGRIEGSPGIIRLAEDRPNADLPQIRIERDALPSSAFSPVGLPPRPSPDVAAPAIRLSKP